MRVGGEEMNIECGRTKVPPGFVPWCGKWEFSGFAELTIDN